jgi:hypothetical protein
MTKYEYLCSQSFNERRITMSTNEDHIPTLEDKTPSARPGNYSPVRVYMKDTLGVIFLGALAGILLIGWMRTEARYRALITQLEITDGKR